MKLSAISLKTLKYLAAFLHLVSLALALCGICLMYLNGNFGTGLAGVGKTPYEETKEFTERFNTDLDDIFHYIEYEDVFAGDGSIDVSRRMLRMTFGPNETEDFTLAGLISYLQTMGYRLDDDFLCTKVAEKDMGASSREGYVDWSASEPEKINLYLTPGMRRSSLEEAALEIMDTLHRYYLAYNRFFAEPSNLHFKISYRDADTGETAVYTNTAELTAESVHEYGRYAYLPGNSVFYDTNMNAIPLSTISSLASNNPFGGTDYYLLAGVDTAYPADDLYAQGQAAYIHTQHSYITGFVMLVCGGLVALVTLLFLIVAAGRQTLHDPQVTLCGFDRASTETIVIFFGLLTAAGLALCRFLPVRLAHLILAQDTWYLAERCIYSAMIYLGALLLFFSMLRRYRAGVIWTDSFLYRWQKRLALLFSRQNFSGRLIAGFLGYLAVNTALVSLAWFLWGSFSLGRLTLWLLTGCVILAGAVFNLWIFYHLFRRAVEQDAIQDAVSRLSSGETSYQLNLDSFDGQERTLAEGINNISAGLETALQEKVKSERLKTDLITNVSHDIKTPLTSIINYVDLLKRANIRDERAAAYLDVLEQKSQRLKTLIEDLVEASKVSSGNIRLEMTQIDLTQMIFQTNGEFEEKFSSRGLQIITRAPEELMVIEADGRRLWRVLENLYNNVYKYALENSRVYVDIERTAGSGELPGQVVFTIKNISSNPLNIRGEELTERFVRGDVARTTEGSGLGLSIARDLTQLQKGRFSLQIDGDLFKVQLAFQLIAPAPQREPEAESGAACRPDPAQAESTDTERSDGADPSDET